jgi:hypothetical protein
MSLRNQFPLLVLVVVLGSPRLLHARPNYVPLRTQVYGGTYSTPAYTQTVATASRPSAPYDLFSHSFQRHYPHAINCFGLDEFAFYRLMRRRAIEIGRYAEERFVAHNSGWNIVENRYHPEYDLYRTLNGRTEFAQVKTHDPVNFSGQSLFRQYIRDLRSDRQAHTFLIPDDHIPGVLQALESDLQAARRQGNQAEAAFLASQRERIQPMGASYGTLVAEAAEAQRAARNRIIAHRIGYTFTAVVAVLPVGYDTYRWWNGELSGAALAYSATKSGTLLAVGLGTSKILSQQAAFKASPWRTGGVVAAVLFVVDEAFLIYEYGGFSKATSNPAFVIETGGNVGAFSFGLAGGIYGGAWGTGVGASIGGPVGAVIGGCVGGVLVGGTAAILGYFGGTRLTSWLLETLDPEFYYSLKIDQIDRAIANSRETLQKLEVSPN